MGNQTLNGYLNLQWITQKLKVLNAYYQKCTAIYKQLKGFNKINQSVFLNI